MNLYRLFTASGSHYWVLANTSDAAIRYVERVAKDHVSSWFIGGTPMPHCQIHNA